MLRAVPSAIFNGIDEAIAGQQRFDDEEVERLLDDLTDAGNARWICKRVGGDLRFQGERRAWWHFDGVAWRPDRNGEVLRKVEGAIRDLLRIAADLPQMPSSGRLGDHASKSLSLRRFEAALKMAEHQLPVLREDFDRDDALLGVRNGVIDLRTGTFREARREDLITRTAGTAYDASATAPRWEQFLERVFGPLAPFIQRAVGYCLGAETSEQCWFLLYGVGANGKTTFLQVIGQLLADYAQHAAAATFLQRRQDGASNDLARMAGARFVSVTEWDENRKLADGLIKQITGDDPITARFLYREFFQFRPGFKIWIASNHKPVIRDGSLGMWRRVRCVPFETIIPEHERDGQLLAKLLDELPGVLNWALDGARAWRSGGLQAPPEVLAATEAYRVESDPIAQFVDDECRLGEDLTAGARELYHAYEAWSKAAGERETLSEKAFAARLDGRGITTYRTKAGRFRLGVQLNSGVG